MNDVTPIGLCRAKLPAGFLLVAFTEPASGRVVPDRDGHPSKGLPLVCGKPAGHDGDHTASVTWPR